jgi:outer membrane protein TolC
MGQDLQSVWVAAESLLAGQGPPGRLADWEAKALESRPEIAEMAHHEASAKNEVDKQRAAHLPSLSLFGDYEIDTEAFHAWGDNYTVGVMIELNLFTGGRQVARTKEARAVLREVEAGRRELSTAVVVETRQAFLLADSAWNRIQVAAASVEQADESLRIVADRYQNGLVTVVDLMEAQTATEQARFDHLQAIYDYRTARVRLLQAAGTLDADALATP